MVILEILWAIFKPFLTTRLGAYAVAIIIVVCGSAYGGWHYRGLQAESDQLAAIKSALEEQERQALIDDRWIREVEVIKTVIVEREIEVSRDAVKTDLCVDGSPSPDFRMLYNRATGIANTTTASSTDGTASAIRRFIAGD